MAVLVIDNIDSFVYNLVQYVGELGGNPIVVDNKTPIEDIKDIIRDKKVDRIIISPGPKRPEDAGVSNEVIREFHDIPILGVCLGHQCIGYVFGAKVNQARHLKHGKTDMIEHENSGVFEGVPNPFEATRYHSLAIDGNTLPKCLQVTARSKGDGEIMGIKHREYPAYGLQFHPESILTEHGHTIIKNFLNI